jgi:hypothetical protein
MKNGVIVLNPVGCFLGNTSMQYLFAKAHAERVGAELLCDAWIGESVFDIPRNRVGTGHRDLPRRDELSLKPTETNVEIRCYAQRSEAMIYSQAEARSWLPLTKSVEEVFTNTDEMELWDSDFIVGHLRRGDYKDFGYVLVSEKSYHDCARENGWEKETLRFVTESNPKRGIRPTGTTEFIADFYRLVYAPVLMRGNSSFSWLAGLLNTTGRVFSPVIDGLNGGMEHDCNFIEGNWPKFANLEACGDLRLKE